MKSKMLILGIALIVCGVVFSLLNTGNLPYPTYILIAGVAVVGVYILTNLREMAKRSTMYGLNAILMSVFMVAILVVVYLIAQNRDKTWDLSVTGKYALDNQTASILDNLQTKVNILLFYPTLNRSSGEFEAVKTLLDEYARRNEKVTYQLLDASENYETALKYQALLNSPMEPTLITEVDVNGQPFREKAKGLKQEDISNAIKKVTHREAVTAYFLVGHNERKLESEGPTGLAHLKNFLSEENINANPLRLGAAAEIPPDADIVALIGPEEDLTETEIASLKRFVLSGGSLLVALDPGMCPLTAAALKDFGVEVGDNVVIEMAVGATSLEDLLRGNMTARPSQTVGIDKFDPSHEITKDLGNSSVTLIEARTINRIPSPPEGITLSILAESKGGNLQGTGLPYSWAEADPKSLSSETATAENIFDSSRDKAGPVALVVAADLDLAKVPDGKPDIQNPNRHGKVIIAGDSDFLTNGGMSGKRGGSISRGQLDFALNIFNWLTGQVDLITIREREADNTSVILTADQKALVRNLLVVLIPFILIPGVGILVGLYRRLRYV